MNSHKFGDIEFAANSPNPESPLDSNSKLNCLAEFEGLIHDHAAAATTATAAPAIFRFLF